jgi:hypothetical protein
MTNDNNVGKIFGYYKIIAITEPLIQPNGKRKKRYLCECVSCGAQKLVDVHKVLRDTKSHCKNCMQHPTESLVGQEFGLLTVLERAQNHVQPNGSTKVMWKCQCSCGKIVNVRAHQLKSGHTRSCGCAQDELLLENKKDKMIGRRYNKLVVIDYSHSENGRRWWRCKCDCGNECVVSSVYLHSPKTIGCCGCEGSKAENDMANLLDKQNIIYQKQYKFNDCKDIRALPFDFAIFNNDNRLIFLIELHGEQHYSPFTYCGESKEQKQLNFEDRVKKDRIKEQYCVDNGIPLLIIKYTDFNKLYVIFADYYERNKNNQLNRVIEKSEQDFKKVKLAARSCHSNGIYQIDLQNKSIIKKWDTISDICKEFNFWDSAIIDCCARRQKTAYGYGWAYAEDNFNLADTLNFCLNKKIGHAEVTLQLDLQTNDVIAEWESASAAARAFNCSPKSISSCCQGKNKSCKGFGWKYKKDYVGQ